MTASNTLRKSVPRNPNVTGAPAGRWLHLLPVFFIGLACSSAVTTNAAIKIGAVTCLSGGLSTFGVSSIQGAKLAVEEINSSGGVLGQPVDLIVEDNQSKAGEAAKIPLLTPTATNVAITKVGDYVFRSCFIDPFTGQVMARFALDHLKAKRALIL